MTGTAAFWAVGSWAQTAPEPEIEVPTISTLEGVSPPQADTDDIIKDKLAAQALGKALFWDIQAGSDGQACASCHFHAGADIRIRNQVNPGHDDIFDEKVEGGVTGPNEALTEVEFPFRKLADIDDRNSDILHDKNDRFSSQGTFAGEFISATKRHGKKSRRNKRGKDKRKAHYRHHGSKYRAAREKCDLNFDPDNNPFHDRGLIFRKVEPRHTPTVINAAFNHRQFWDGRANNVFNGVDPFGRRTNEAVPSAGVLVKAKNKLKVELKKLEIRNSSLASQAVGPPLSDFEMSCSGRTFPDLGRKLLKLRALASQQVRSDDSLFSRMRGLVDRKGYGLRKKYDYLVKKAFHKDYWNVKGNFSILEDGTVVKDKKGFTMMELNFSLFWGLAVQEYEKLLISDQSKFDSGELSEAGERGKEIFLNKGKCVNCHKGPLLSGATVPPLQNEQLVERMIMGDNGIALYDNAFYNIGVRPTFEDLGVGGEDPFGNPLSFTLQWIDLLRGNDPIDPGVREVDSCKFEVPFDTDNCSSVPSDPSVIDSLRSAVDGAFKVPILRNVGLNPPYFHNGGQATLKQVVEFYNRGGDRRGPNGDDTTGFEGNKSNLDPDIQNLGLSEDEQDDLVTFMLELSDPRVACHMGPFDHPSLKVTNGHDEVAKRNGTAKDRILFLPAVGKGGLEAIDKPCFPNSGDLFGEMQDVLAKVGEKPRRSRRRR